MTCSCPYCGQAWNAPDFYITPKGDLFYHQELLYKFSIGEGDLVRLLYHADKPLMPMELARVLRSTPRSIAARISKVRRVFREAGLPFALEQRNSRQTIASGGYVLKVEGVPCV